MLRYLRIAIVALAFTAVTAAPAATADDGLASDPDLSAFHANTLTCNGTSIPVLQTPSFSKILVVQDGTITGAFNVFQLSVQTTSGEVLLGTTPALNNGSNLLGGRELVTCTFTGVISGRHFIVLGVFTPLGQ